MYVHDPAYDGSSTFYTMKIQGINEYRLQTSADVLKTVDAILEAGITANEDGTFTINPADGVAMEVQEKFWSYLDEAGIKFAQESIDYVNTDYASYIESYFAYTPDQVAENSNMQAAFGMVLWGFGEVDEEGAFTDSMGKTYDLTTDTVDAKVYWVYILDAYGYDLSDAGINYEKAGDLTIQDYVKEAYIAAEGQVEGGVPSISGITTGTVTSDDGVEREYVKVVIEGVDPTAIFNRRPATPSIIIPMGIQVP